MLIFVSKKQSFIIIALRFYLTGGILFNYFSGLLFNYIIHNARKAMIEGMNAGRIRVLFGSTSMLGTGVNAQKRAVAIHHADTPWRPSDLAQRDGRAIRKGNEVAKFAADNKVDVIIYAVEKSLDSYKFNLLQNKQTFINQLKSNNLGSRTIDEGSLDEGSGMNFSEYVAILSGNTDLLEKAKLEKKINALESEKRTFNKSKSSAIYKFDDSTRTIEGNTKLLSSIQKDLAHFNKVVQVDGEGNKLNPIKLEGVNGSNPKEVGAKLNELASNSRTNGEYLKIGELFGFKLLVKTEESQKEGSLFRDNRFFVEGEGGIKYNYNNGHIALDPVLASRNFINALEKIPNLIEKYENENTRLSKDLPILKEVIDSIFRKEPELKDLKMQLDALNRQINLSLENKDKPIEQAPAQVAEEISLAKIIAQNTQPTDVISRQHADLAVDKTVRSNQPMTIKEVVDANPGRIIIARPDVGQNISQPPKRQGFKL